MFSQIKQINLNRREDILASIIFFVLISFVHINLFRINFFRINLFHNSTRRFIVFIINHFCVIMSQQQNHAHESHVSTVNKIKAMSKIIIQICRVCKLINRFCYVIVEMFNKCVFCAEIEKIIKQCDVTSHNYISSTFIIHASASSKDVVLAFSFNSTNIVSFSSLLNLLNDAFVVMSMNKSNDAFVFNSFKSIRDIFAFNKYISSAKDFHFSLSSIERIAHAIKTMKNKLSTIMNKLMTLKIDNIRLLKRVEKLKSKIENMKIVDEAIDYFNKNFNDEVILHTRYIVCFH